MKRLLIAGLMMFGLLAGPTLGEGVYPDIPKATGAPHPEGNEFWRTNHMYLLKHDRDLTVHEGDRDVQASIAECVTCHAVNGPDAKPVSIASDQHFCRVCHDYAAVKIDCFQCHNSLPQELGKAALIFKEPESPTLDVLLAYLQEVSQ